MKINKNAVVLTLSLVLMAIISLTSGYGASAKNGMKVELISDGDIRFNVYTEALTVGDFIDELVQRRELVMSKDLDVSPSPDTVLKQGMEVSVRTLKEYAIEEGESRYCIDSYGTTVDEVLENAGIVLGEGDYTIPTGSTKVEAGSRIIIANLQVKQEQKDIEIQAPVTYVPDDELYQGQKQEISPGEKGIESVSLENTLYNGEPISSQIIQAEIIKEPVPAVMAQGTKVAEMVETPQGALPYKYAITMEATAYDNSFVSCGKHPDDPYYGITATGTKAGPGTVAIDPSIIPFGTKLYVETTDDIPSYGFATAEDTGGAIVGNRIDLWHPSHEEALAFGRRQVKVYVLLDTEAQGE